MNAKEALVVGAGPSGLVAAISLAREGLKVQVWEKEKQIGGYPHWHPSAHDTQVGKQLFSYIGIDLSECFQEISQDLKHVINGTLIEVRVSKKNPPYVCERGSRPTSLDSVLFRIAEAEGVKFTFERKFTPEDLGRVPETTILATGLSPEMYDFLQIPYSIYAGYFGQQEIEKKTAGASLFIVGFSNEYGYSSWINGFYYVLLFSRKEISPENLGEFKQLVEKHDGVKFDQWKRFMGYTPKTCNLFHRGRVILTGTLAGVVEPVLGYGITGALLSGKISALTALDREKGKAEFARFTRGIAAAIAKKKEPGYVPIPPRMGEVWFQFPEE